MDKPYEQRKEFWESYGWKQTINYNAPELNAEQPPVIDLNNLFKIAVPKVIVTLRSRNKGWTESRAIHYLFQAWELEYRIDKVFELALFRVIEGEVTHG